jgi:apolipoprotein N-acyltransferase
MNKLELKYILIVSILLTLSFPPFWFGFLAPVALAIFLWFIRHSPPRDCFRLGYWLGLIWGAMTLFWIAASTLTGAVLAITINAFHYSLVWWLYGIFKRRSEIFALVALPFIWVSMEYFRLFSDIRFNWLNLAHTQTYYTPFIQIIEITGYHILSFVIVLLAISLYSLIKFKSKYKSIPMMFSLLVILSFIIYGFIRIKQLDRMKLPLIKAGMVQPNVDPFEKWEPLFQKEAFEILMEGSQELVSDSVDLIVWPETATPFFLKNRIDELKRISQFTRSYQVFLLTGTPDYGYDSTSQEYWTYNAAFFFRPGRMNFEHYYKMALVPASESMPFKQTLTFLRDLDVGGGDFFPGKEFKVFHFLVREKMGYHSKYGYERLEHDTLQQTEIGLSAIICYESVFPQIIRQFVSNGSNLFTIITNDGWFGLTSGPYQHKQIAILRAIENRRGIIRCANTGISCFIDPIGRFYNQANLSTKANLKALLPIVNETTFYTENGDWFGKMILWVSLLLLIVKLLSIYILKYQSAG